MLDLAVLDTARNYKLSDYGLTPKFPQAFDSVRLKDFVNCRSLFYFRHVLGQVHKDKQDHPSLLWGTMWHEVMEIHHRDKNPTKALTHIHENWPGPPLDATDRFARTQERMANIYYEYCKHYGKHDLERWNPIRHEQTFDIWCKEGEPCIFSPQGCGLRWCGRMDMPAENIQTSGNRFVWDFKTTAWLMKHTFDEYKYGFQMPGYFWALAHLTGRMPTGVFVDLLHTIKTKQDFYRQELRYTPYQVKDWLHTVRLHIAEAQRLFELYPDQPDMWAKNWHWCNQFSGCSFKDIHYTPDMRDTQYAILQQYFEEKRWDPAEEF